MRIARFNGVSQTMLRPTLVAMVTKNCKFQYKISYKSACVRYNPDTCTQHGFLRVARFNGVSQTILRPTLVAMVTKNCKFQYKISYKSACVRYNPDTCIPQGVMRVGQFNVVSQTLLRQTPCLLYTSPSPRDGLLSRMPSSA